MANEFLTLIRLTPDLEYAKIRTNLYLKNDTLEYIWTATEGSGFQKAYIMPNLPYVTLAGALSGNLYIDPIRFSNLFSGRRLFLPATTGLANPAYLVFTNLAKDIFMWATMSSDYEFRITSGICEDISPYWTGTLPLIGSSSTFTRYPAGANITVTFPLPTAYWELRDFGGIYVGGVSSDFYRLIGIYDPKGTATGYRWIGRPTLETWGGVPQWLNPYTYNYWVINGDDLYNGALVYRPATFTYAFIKYLWKDVDNYYYASNEIGVADGNIGYWKSSITRDFDLQTSSSITFSRVYTGGGTPPNLSSFRTRNMERYWYPTERTETAFYINYAKDY